MGEHGSVEEYVAALPEATRNVVVEIRALVHAALPDAEERISYDIPTFTVDGKPVLHVGGWVKHVSIYPVPGPSGDDPELAEDLAPYVAGKGTLKLDLGEPVPYDLVKRVVTALAAQRAPGA